MLNELREAQAKFENGEIGKKELEEVINRMKICVSSVDDAIHQLRQLIMTTLSTNLGSLLYFARYNFVQNKKVSI